MPRCVQLSTEEMPSWTCVDLKMLPWCLVASSLELWLHVWTSKAKWFVNYPSPRRQGIVVECDIQQKPSEGALVPFLTFGIIGSWASQLLFLSLYWPISSDSYGEQMRQYMCGGWWALIRVNLSWFKDKLMGVSVREFQRFLWGEETRLEYGGHPPMGWDLALNQ